MLAGLGILANSLHGSAGAWSTCQFEGRTYLIPRGRRKASQTAGAVYVRLVYGVLEGLWLSMTPAERAAWLQGPRPKGGTGRGQFGRVNWYGVEQYDKWTRVPPTRRYQSAPRTAVEPAEDVPPLLKKCLGGGWSAHSADHVGVVTEERSAEGVGVTAQAAMNAAFTNVQAESWMPGGGEGCRVVSYWWEIPGGYKARFEERRAELTLAPVPGATYRAGAFRWLSQAGMTYHVGEADYWGVVMVNTAEGWCLVALPERPSETVAFTGWWQWVPPASCWAAPDNAYQAAGFHFTNLAHLWQQRG